MILENGSHGSDVRHWQEFLGVTVDGDYGPNTIEATKVFQKAHGLAPDGKVGPKTIDVAEEMGYHTEVIIEKPHRVGSVENNNFERLLHVAPLLKITVEKFIEIAASHGMMIQVTQGLRTFKEQDDLYKQGRTRPGKKVTNARGGQSNHNYGLAVDVAPVINGSVSFDDHLYKFADWAKEAGLDWGGLWTKFRDLPHLQIPGIPKPSVLLATYNDGGLQAVWKKYKAN